MTTPKHEWRKKEKDFYLPKTKPIKIDVPAVKYLTIKGKGSPTSDHFAECISALYSVSYAIKMTPKKGEIVPDGYFDYTVYPLEGEWDLNDEAKKKITGQINKDDFVYKLMIRQPDFVDDSFFSQMVELTNRKKPQELLNSLQLETITDGLCIQMMHIGSYDNEPTSFKMMEKYCNDLGLHRRSKAHREIYLNDFRKVAAYKLKTVLRFKIA